MLCFASNKVPDPAAQWLVANFPMLPPKKGNVKKELESEPVRKSMHH
jgi:hypothetical protein